MTRLAVYIGWLRSDSQPWLAVTRASSREQCWDLLLAAGVPAGAGVERIVLEEGKQPWQREKSR